MVKFEVPLQLESEIIELLNEQGYKINYENDSYYVYKEKSSSNTIKRTS